ncbi:MAG: polyprenyl synthetase family protein [Clostridia bacterium]
MDFKEKMAGYADLINRELEIIMAKSDEPTYKAMAYSLLAGGKRVRPVLTLGCCEALDGDMELALKYGCAIEMIHTYSLIHDDLPCMDNDSLRRGRPTNHIVFGEAEALLAGDGLLNLAAEHISNNSANPERDIRAVSALYSASGALGMIGGQADDIYAETHEPTKELVEKIHRRKTGALILAATELGAIAAGADKDYFREYAVSLGLAFQIKDDILDVESSAEELGKSNSDAENNKATFVSVYGLDEAKRLLELHTETALRSIEPLGEKGEFLRGMAEYLLKRSN